MELLVAHGLELWRAGARLFGPLDLTLVSGTRVALTGRSGSGLTSLLQLLAGELQPSQGTVRRAPGSRVGLARQQADNVAAGSSAWQLAAQALAPLAELERQLRQLEQRLDSEAALHRYGELATAFEAAGGYSAETDLRQLLEVFGLDRRSLELPFTDLSGGQQRRLLLAAALAGRPDVLLLDTPDAGLDEQARELLQRRLRSWPGAVLFSSHDRDFINKTASHVAELAGGNLAVRRGGFPARSHKRAPATAGQARQLLLSGQELKVRVGQQLLHVEQLAVSRGDRIALIGPNGSGKSSLIAHIAMDHHAGQGDSGLEWHGRVKVLHVDQVNYGLTGNLSALDNLALRMSRQRARQLLGLTHLPVQLWDEPVSSLGAGQRARVGLALVLSDESDLLLLDELDSQLDLPGIRLLEDALLTRPGAVLLVSHDRQLNLNVAGTVWSVQGSTLRQWRGGLAGYLAGRLRREEGLGDPERQVPESVPPTAAVSVEQLEDALLELDEQLSLPGLTGRQAERLERRRVQLLGDLMQKHDSRFSRPLPRFHVREAGLELQADLNANRSSLEFSAVAAARPLLAITAGVAHLRLQVPADRCLLPHVRRALLNAATRLVFYALPVRVVQYWDASAPSRLLLEPADNGWYALARDRFEQLEGWVRPTVTPAGKRRRRRRKRRTAGAAP